MSVASLVVYPNRRQTTGMAASVAVKPRCRAADEEIAHDTKTLVENDVRECEERAKPRRNKNKTINSRTHPIVVQVLYPLVVGNAWTLIFVQAYPMVQTSLIVGAYHKNIARLVVLSC